MVAIQKDGQKYMAFVARLSPQAGANVKVIDPAGKEHWIDFSPVNDVNPNFPTFSVAGLWDDDGKLYPAAEDLLAEEAVGQVAYEIQEEAKEAEKEKAKTKKK